MPLVKKLMINILNLKFAILLEYQNIKIFIPSWSEEVFMIKKVEKNMPRTYIVNDLNREGIVRTFYKKELQKQIKKSLELK